MRHLLRPHPLGPPTRGRRALSTALVVAALAGAACSGGGDDAGGGATTTEGERAPSPTGDDAGLDVVEVDVVGTPEEHRAVVTAATRVAEGWFTAAWQPTDHEQGDDWVADLGHPEPEAAERLLTGPTRRADDPGDVQAADYWADIRAVLWNGAEVPEERRWLDDLDGTELHFATAAGRTDEPVLVARDGGALAWVRVPVAVEAGISGLRPDGSQFDLRIYVQGDLELRPVGEPDAAGAEGEPTLAVTWLDASVGDERRHSLQVSQEDGPATTPEYLTEQ